MPSLLFFSTGFDIDNTVAYGGIVNMNRWSILSRNKD